MIHELPPKSVAVVLGTRPEVVKLAHVIRLLGDAALVVHSGQHYDDSLSKVFFEAFDLAIPDVELNIGGTARGAQIGEATRQLDELFTERSPQSVVVQGDTNTALAGALAANAGEIPLVHIEAGLRSFDRRMPEEHNRVAVDHLADLCCAPTDLNVANLAAESITGPRVVQTGNTIVEAVDELLPDAEARREIRTEFGLEFDGFVLATLHRPENVDDPERLAVVLDELGSLPIPVLYPMHPRTAATIERFELGGKLEGITVTEPLDYVSFLGLAAESAVLVSDSGGVQEEASIIKRPVAVVRRSTERPEVQGTFAQLTEGSIGEAIAPWLVDTAATRDRLAKLPSPYGDGSASQRSVEALANLVG